MTRTVVALFDDFTTANEAVQDLVDSGFRRDDISYMANDTTGDYARNLGIRRESETNMSSERPADVSGAGVGAGVGAAVGGIGGLLVGLGAMMIPGVGPVVAAGPLAVALGGLAGAGAGAVAGGIIGALVDMGIPEETAGYYAEGIHRGGTLITVRTDDYLSDRAVEILNRHNPVNLRERSGQWRQSGWTGFQQTQPMEEQRMDREEGRQIPDTGYGQGNMANMSGPQGAYGAGPGTVQPPSGTYGMGREPYNPGQDRDVRSPGGQMPSREIESGGDTFGGEGTVGSEYGNVGERGGGLPETEVPFNAGQTDMGPGSRETNQPMGTGMDYGDYDIYDARFRNDFQMSPDSREATYEEYAPAYHYGYDLAHEDRYHGKSWEDIQDNVRSDWELQHPGTWDRFKMSVRHAWEDVKDALD